MQGFRECLGGFRQLAGSPRPARVPLLHEHELRIIRDNSTAQGKLRARGCSSPALWELWESSVGWQEGAGCSQERGQAGLRRHLRQRRASPREAFGSRRVPSTLLILTQCFEFCSEQSIISDQIIIKALLALKHMSLTRAINPFIAIVATAEELVRCEREISSEREPGPALTK